MRRNYPIFQSHLDLAHSYWKKIVKQNSIVIDATCGNGFDTLALAKLSPKKIYAFDIQREAIEKTKSLLKEKIPDAFDKVSFYNQCHRYFSKEIQKESIDLVVYNLGYLPGGNKQLTTTTTSTLKSLSSALDLLREGGALSITCYPGHSEGEKEEKAITVWAESLCPKLYLVCWHRFINRKKAPSLLLIQKNISTVKGLL